MSTAQAIGLAFVGGVCATLALARIATRMAWVDAGTDAPLRKLQPRPVPPVGGAAIAISVGLLALIDRTALPAEWTGWTALALAAAFTVGLIDDLLPAGLRPLHKLCGQIAAGVLFAVPMYGDGAPSALCAAVFAVAAQNALNTFDNADGAAASLAMCGLAAGAPVVAAAVAGFLPFNLWLGVRDERTRAFTPSAYLGDSGSHLLGLALLASPLGAVALCLPLLDLARVSLARIAERIPPWTGDRRHLAHRLQAAGLGRTAVVLALLAIAAPPIASAAIGLPLAPGLAVTAVAFCAAVFVTPASR